MERYTVRIIKTGEPVCSLDKKTAQAWRNAIGTGAVLYVERDSGRPYRVHAWDTADVPLVHNEDGQILPLYSN